GAGGGGGGRVAEQAGHEAHILGHGEVGQQPHLLYHVAHAPAQLLGALLAHVAPIYLNSAAIGLDKAVEGFEQGRFAAAAGAQQHQRFALGYLKTNIIDHHLRPKALGEVRHA
nr:hypothetical protein [Tanacetum cinerariifolium]